MKDKILEEEFEDEPLEFDTTGINNSNQIKDSNINKDIKNSENVNTTTIKSNSKKDIYMWIISIVCILFLVFVFTYYNYLPKEKPLETYDYNHFTFVKEGGLWKTTWEQQGQPFIVRLHYGPKELQNMLIEGAIDGSFFSDEVYITFDPDEKDHSFTALAAGELGINMKKILGVIPLSACSKKDAQCGNQTPVINCSYADRGVIYLKYNSSVNKTVLNANCVTIEGSGDYLIQSSDRFLYFWMGIIKE